MKTLTVILISFITVLPMWAGEGNTSSYKSKHGQLNVSIDGLTSEQGSLKVLLFNQEVGFPSEDWNAMYVVDLDVETDGSSLAFESIPFGEYAIYVYHDENSNGKFDKNWAGAAKEGFGYTNRTKGKRVTPLYGESTFSFEEHGTQLNIDLVPAGK